MKIKEGEEILKEYFFTRTKDSFHKAILTNRRLVFATNSSEENYPLSKLTSVKTDKEKSGFRSKVLGFSLLGTLILVIITGIMLFEENEPMWNEMNYLIPVYLILIWVIRFGLKPDKITTSLVITQMGGTKSYTAQNSHELQTFIDKINEQLI